MHEPAALGVLVTLRGPASPASLEEMELVPGEWRSHPFRPSCLFLGLLSRKHSRGTDVSGVYRSPNPRVGWEQSAGKTGMALLLRNERSHSPS